MAKHERIRALDKETADYEYEGTGELNGAPIPQFVDYDLTARGRKLQKCHEHLMRGDAAAAIDQFFLSECIYPEPDQEQIIRYRLICAGPGLLGGCGLEVVQYDSEGNEIG